MQLLFLGADDVELRFHPRLTVVAGASSRLRDLIDEAAMGSVDVRLEVDGGPMEVFDAEDLPWTRAQVLDILENWRAESARQDQLSTHESEMRAQLIEFQQQRVVLDKRYSALLAQQTEHDSSVAGAVLRDQLAAAVDEYKELSRKVLRAEEIAQLWQSQSEAFRQLAPSDPELPHKLALNERELRNIQRQLEQLSTATPQLSTEDTQRLTETHSRLEDAQRVVERRNSRKAIRNLEAAEAEEAEVLKTLGLNSYLDYLLASSIPERDQQSRAQIEGRQKQLLDERADLEANQESVFSRAEIEQELRHLHSETTELIGSEPSRDLAGEVRKWAQQAEDAHKILLSELLKQVGVVDEQDVVAASVDWLESPLSQEQTPLDPDFLRVEIQNLENEIERLDEEILGIEAQLRSVESRQDESEVAVQSEVSCSPVLLGDEFFSVGELDENLAFIAALAERAQVILLSNNTDIREWAISQEGVVVEVPERAPSDDDMLSSLAPPVGEPLFLEEDGESFLESSVDSAPVESPIAEDNIAAPGWLHDDSQQDLETKSPEIEALIESELPEREDELPESSETGEVALEGAIAADILPPGTPSGAVAEFADWPEEETKQAETEDREQKTAPEHTETGKRRLRLPRRDKKKSKAQQAEEVTGVLMSPKTDTETKVKQSHRCEKHPLMFSTGQCTSCKDFFCADCILELSRGRRMCVDCALAASGIRRMHR